MGISITIENVDEATAKWIDEEAERRGISVEALTLQLIHKGISVEHKSLQLQTYHDLDFLAGTWDGEQATEFLNAIADFEQADGKPQIGL